MEHASTETYRERYTLHVMTGIVVALALLIAAVKLWPAPSNDTPDPRIYSTRGQETIPMEEIVQTRQKQEAPPPPAPLPPVVVPNDVVLEDVELEFTDSFLAVDEPGEGIQETPGDTEGTPTQFARVSSSPKPVRIVEPRYSRAAEKRDIRAEVVVEVLVDEKGRVQETRVLERFLLGNDDEDPKTPVSELGYGLEEAALSAAERWLFRPARENGQPVRAYHTLTFTFGV